jgi:hypothetical protein
VCIPDTHLLKTRSRISARDLANDTLIFLTYLISLRVTIADLDPQRHFEAIAIPSILISSSSGSAGV